MVMKEWKKSIRRPFSRANARRHGRRVPFKAILHELMAEKVGQIEREAVKKASDHAKKKFARFIHPA
jgi:hypothetical protein